MIKWRRTRNAVVPDEEEAQRSLRRAQQQEQTAHAQAREARPVIRKLEEHLQDNNFGRLIWAMYKGAR